MKQPDPQPLALQTSPEPQLVPAAAVVHIVALVPGSQLWHGLLVLMVPDG
jgi:hypothetical protein